MTQHTLEKPKEARSETMKVLEDIVREGARRMLQVSQSMIIFLN